MPEARVAFPLPFPFVDGHCVAEVRREPVAVENLQDRRAVSAERHALSAGRGLALEERQELDPGRVHLGNTRQVDLDLPGAIQRVEQRVLGRRGVVDRHRAADRHLAHLVLAAALAGLDCDFQFRLRLVGQGEMSFAAAWSICSGRKGLTTQAFAPAICPSCLRLSRDSVVSMMIGMKRYSWRFLASFTNAMPSMTGMFTSQIARWMRLPSSFSSACRPSAACTTSYPAPSSAMLTTSRREAESSITRIFFVMCGVLRNTSGFQACGCVPAARRDCRIPHASRIRAPCPSSIDRHRAPHPCPG